MCDTTKQREIIFRTFNGVCFYCEQSITFVNGTRDHFWPRAKGGWNGIRNLVLACADCNTRKADRFPTLLEFYKLQQYRPDISVQDFHAPIPNANSKRAQKKLARELERREKCRAKRAAKNAAHIAMRQKQAAERRENLFLSNLAGPYFADVNGVVRVERGPSYPFKPSTFVNIQ